MHLRPSSAAPSHRRSTFSGKAVPGQPLTSEQFLDLQQAIFLGAWIGTMAIVAAPALIGTGASLGQRTVYLAPAPKNGSRWRLIARALIVQGAIPTGLFLGFPTSYFALLLAVAASVSVDPA